MYKADVPGESAGAYEKSLTSYMIHGLQFMETQMVQRQSAEVKLDSKIVELETRLAAVSNDDVKNKLEAD